MDQVLQAYGRGWIDLEKRCLQGCLWACWVSEQKIAPPVVALHPTWGFLGVNNLQISLGHFKNEFRLLIFLGLIFIKGTHLVSGILTSAAEESSS